MSSTRGPKYPSCSLACEGRSSFSFSKASTPFAVTKSCVEHLVGRLFPGKAPAKPAPAGHESDLETLAAELEARRAGAASPEAGAPVVTLRIYRGELEGLWPVELAPTLDLAKHLDELLYWSRNDAAGRTSRLQRTGGRKGFHCAATARLGWGVYNPPS